MYGDVQRTKWDRERGQFLVIIDSQIASVVNEVAERLGREFSGEVASLQYLVWQKSHPEHSVLVVTPSGEHNPELVSRMMASMRRHLDSSLQGRALARAG